MAPDSPSMSRSAASLLASRFGVAVIAVAFLGVSTRLLTLEEMAVFAVYNTFCNTLTVLCSMGMLTSCLKQVPAFRAAGSPGRAAGLIRAAVLVYIVGAVLVTAACWVAAEP